MGIAHLMVAHNIAIVIITESTGANAWVIHPVMPPRLKVGIGSWALASFALKAVRVATCCHGIFFPTLSSISLAVSLNSLFSSGLIQDSASLRRRGHFLPSNRSLRKPKSAIGIAFNGPTKEPNNFKEFYCIVHGQGSTP